MDEPFDHSDDGNIIARVIVTRVIADNGDIVDHVLAVDREGIELGLAEALGMMRLAEDTLIRSRMDDD